MWLLQAQALPKKTKGHLYYSNQEGLDASRNKVQSRPKIGKLKKTFEFNVWVKVIVQL